MQRQALASLQQKIDHLILKVVNIQSQPEIQLTESRLHQLFFDFIHGIADSYDFDLIDTNKKYALVRRYSDENQKKILEDLKTVRIALIQYSDSLQTPFDTTQNEILKKYQIKEALKKFDPLPPLLPALIEEEIRWKKVGDFNKIRDSDIFNSRTLIYYSTLTHSNIKEIYLQNSNCNVSLGLVAPNKKIYRSLFKKNLPKTKCMSYLFFFYNVTIQNLSFLESLLNTATKIENSVDDIRSDIINTAKPFLLNKSPTISGWMKEGDFTIYPSAWGPTINRELKYTNINPSIIEEVRLFGYKDNSPIKLKLTMAQTYLKKLSKVYKSKFHNYIIPILDRDSLQNFLKNLAEIDSSIHNIAKDLLNGYELKDTSKVTTAFRMGLHDRLGKDSIIHKVFKEHKLAEPKLVDCIFSFLFPPPKKAELPPPKEEVTNYNESTDFIKKDHSRFNAKRNPSFSFRFR